MRAHASALGVAGAAARAPAVSLDRLRSAVSMICSPPAPSESYAGSMLAANTLAIVTAVSFITRSPRRAACHGKNRIMKVAKATATTSAYALIRSLMVSRPILGFDSCFRPRLLSEESPSADWRERRADVRRWRQRPSEAATARKSAYRSASSKPGATDSRSPDGAGRGGARAGPAGATRATDSAAGCRRSPAQSCRACRRRPELRRCPRVSRPARPRLPDSRAGPRGPRRAPAARCRRVRRRACESSPCREPGRPAATTSVKRRVEIVDHRLQLLLLLGAHVAQDRARVLVRAARQRLVGDAVLLHQALDADAGHDDADRAGHRRRVRHQVVGGHREIVARPTSTSR